MHDRLRSTARNGDRQLAAVPAAERIGPAGAPAPIVLDSPHSGTHYPSDFRPAVDQRLLRGGEDRFVDDLFLGATAHGATMVRALFARTYIDPNRAVTDIDADLLDDDWDGPVEPSAHGERGVGLIFRLIGEGQPIYDRPLTADEVRGRIEAWWRPYHDLLARTLDETHERHGLVWHLNCHSMQPVGSELSPDPGRSRPDFVLGDRDGQSSGPGLTRLAASVLKDLGYSVGLNDPYKGAWILQRYGRPDEGRHSLQIEVNRRLYMRAHDMERHEGYARLKADLDRFAARLCAAAGRSGAEVAGSGEKP